MNTRKSIVNFELPVLEPPFSEEKAAEMTEYLNDQRKYLHFEKSLSWLLAYNFGLYRQDAIKFVFDWRQTL